MNILIIEDEKLSAERLIRMIRQLLPECHIFPVKDSVKSATAFLQTHPDIDLGFFDIQLADGLSFEIFEQTPLNFPVIFTTAFNEYAIRAFKVNSIDYLLKPIDEDELKQALVKFEAQKPNKQAILSEQAIAQALQMLSKTYKSRFLVKVGEHIRMIAVEEIMLFYSMEKATFIKTQNNREYAIDYSLDQLETLLDPKDFFRSSRQHIIGLGAIKDIIAYSGSRLKIKLAHETEFDILVSRERVSSFKDWLNK